MCNKPYMHIKSWTLTRSAVRVCFPLVSLLNFSLLLLALVAGFSLHTGASPAKSVSKQSMCRLTLVPPSPSGLLSNHRPSLSSAPADPTLSPPTVTVTSGPGESGGSSAADSGWRISVMGFCPELARPLGAPTLILREAGSRDRVPGVTGVRFSAADTVSGDGVSESSVGMLHPLAGWS